MTQFLTETNNYKHSTVRCHVMTPPSDTTIRTPPPPPPPPATRPPPPPPPTPSPPPPPQKKKCNAHASIFYTISNGTYYSFPYCLPTDVPTLCADIPVACGCVSGAAGLIWFVVWMIVVADSPAEHPRISPIERKFIELSIGPQPAVKQVGAGAGWGQGSGSGVGGGGGGGGGGGHGSQWTCEEITCSVAFKVSSLDHPGRFRFRDYASNRCPVS